jgi:hypothetical protein
MQLTFRDQAVALSPRADFHYFAVYRGDTDEEPWDAVLPEVRSYAAHVVREIERASAGLAVRPRP